MKTFYEDHFSVLSKAIFLSWFCCSSLVVCYECLTIVLFIGEASQSCLTCMKTLIIYFSCRTSSVPCNACTTPCVSCNACTATCVTYTLHHTPYYLSSHATFNFVKCMLAMWQWLDPIN